MNFSCSKCSVTAALLFKGNKKCTPPIQHPQGTLVNIQLEKKESTETFRPNRPSKAASHQLQFKVFQSSLLTVYELLQCKVYATQILEVIK